MRRPLIAVALVCALAVVPSTATAAPFRYDKVIINEVPMMEFGINPYDDWEGYEAEREKLLTFLRNSVKNVAIVTTDFHSNWVNDARIKTWPEDGGPVPSGVEEFISGGVADDLFGNEIDNVAGGPGTWTCSASTAEPARKWWPKCTLAG